MLIHPEAWRIPPLRRYLPRELADRYEDENTPLVEVVDMWEWKHDLVSYGPSGPATDHDKIAGQLAKEIREFMEVEELRREDD